MAIYSKYKLKKVIRIACIQQQHYIVQLGAKDKFNMTVAAVLVVNHFVLKSASKSFKNFMDEFPSIKYNFKDLMRLHYSYDIYNSKIAKTKYLEPDLLSFD